MRRLIFGCSIVLVCFLVCGGRLHAQLDLDAYVKFVEEHKNMTAEDLLREYPAGMFRRYAPADINVAQFGPQVANTLALTTYEGKLISELSFMVTERLSYQSYNAAFLDVYKKDLPLYISSDAILHALHRSYDNMLKHIETKVLIDSMRSALSGMHQSLKTQTYLGQELVQKAVRDADVYLTVALTLLDNAVSPVFVENATLVSDILAAVATGEAKDIALFSVRPRLYDFSQLKPRGHYTESEELENYFQCMMWLGRTEIYLTPPQPSEVLPTDDDIRRQCMLSIILVDLATVSQSASKINYVDQIITKFVGEQDNLALKSLIAIVDTTNGGLRPEHLLNDTVLAAFQATVRASGGEQKILSQILIGDGITAIKPAASFMLMGQRFILDSYILANLVVDKVDDRYMPSPLDAMFTLGNDAAAQLLAPELPLYRHYPRNLAGLNYLTTTLSREYWESSLYTTWLNAIRALNPLPDRTSLPLFMQTGAWAQKQLNSQLTSWAELRHDNLLYAKQSYSGYVICFYPSGYVEPVPALYSRIAGFARGFSNFLLTLDERIQLVEMITTLRHMDSTCTMLARMAQKELDGVGFDEREKSKLDNWIVERHVDNCVPFDVFDGTYPKLYYGVDLRIQQDKADFVVADVHTQPFDAAGVLVGNVLHVATGRINMAVIVATDPSDGCATAYVGPVGSFYQHITSGFNRLSDEEWVTLYKDSTVPRPSWVYSYVASAEGETLGEPQTLTTTGVSEPLPSHSPSQFSVAPNPTSGSTTIAFVVPPLSAGASVTIQVVNSSGVVVTTLQCSPLAAGNYITRWDGKSSLGVPVVVGTYFVRVQAGRTNVVQQVVVIR